jgi:gliding motility-associated-like protein
LDTVTIYVLDYSSTIYIPNTFSPNGDNKNDVLYVRGLGIIEMDLFIFDRWGEKVFFSNSQQTGWDGSYEGKMMNPGVFVYYLKVKTADNKIIEKKGNITIIK